MLFCYRSFPCCVEKSIVLLSTDKYGDFIDANRIKNTEDRLKTMKKLVCSKDVDKFLKILFQLET